MDCTRPATVVVLCFCTLLGVIGAGCQTVGSGKTQVTAPVPNSVPRELSKVILPPYVVEPPDILVIDALNVVPKQPYRLRTLDGVYIQVWGTLPDAPIEGTYQIEPGGGVTLGPRYGVVQIAGLTPEQAQQRIYEHLHGTYLREPYVMVRLANVASVQEISGEHMVGPDGTVTLGSYGSVSVAGRTLAQAKYSIEAHLSRYLENPIVSVNVYAYNSKVYYVITEGAGFGDAVYRFPATGNETVLDAVSQINGLTEVSSKRIWIARPTRDQSRVQVMPVCWEDITSRAAVGTNYQVFPGDRIFVAEDKRVAFDTALGKFTAPFERIMGFSLLGAGTATRFSGPVLRGGGNPRSSF